MDDGVARFLKIIIIMYIYHALINALSAHMIHINLHMIFYTQLRREFVYLLTCGRRSLVPETQNEIVVR